MVLEIIMLLLRNVILPCVLRPTTTFFVLHWIFNTILPYRTPSYILPYSTYWIVQPSYLIVPHHTTILPYRTLSYILPHHTLDFLPHPTTTFFVLHVIVGQRRSWFITAPRGRGLSLPLPSLPSPALPLLSCSLPLSLRLPTSHSVTLLNTSSVYQLSTLHQPATPVKMDDDQTSSSQAARPRY